MRFLNFRYLYSRNSYIEYESFKWKVMPVHDFHFIVYSCLWCILNIFTWQWHLNRYFVSIQFVSCHLDVECGAGGASTLNVWYSTEFSLRSPFVSISKFKISENKSSFSQCIIIGDEWSVQLTIRQMMF